MASVGGVFKNLGHFFATVVSKVLSGTPKVVAAADQVAAVVTQDAPTVEAISGLVPGYGPLLVKGEEAAVMVFGAVLAAIHAGGDAVGQKLLDIGLDKTAVDTAIDAYHKVPEALKAVVK
jgi:hypothetical protein